jgi:polysaccharide deacetylase 2 family uncharacterized protein YibQ
MAANSMVDGEAIATRRGPHPLALAYFGVFVLVILVFGTVAYFGRASDGDPVVTLELHGTVPRPANKSAHASVPSALSPKPSGAPSAALAPAGAPVSPGSTAPFADTAPPSLPPQIVPTTIIKPVVAGNALIADPALIEQTQQGPLPRIADDGRTPMTAYAPSAPSDKRPRIAIVISGLGISAKATSAAIAGLPPEVTLAFAPYDDDVQRWVSEARRRGHEVLLELPMEPYDFPDSDPGPHTLRAGVGEESNTQRLTWSLTRFTGYAGVTNLLGGRFLGDPDSLEPVMTFLARRGLFFFDSGPAARSAAPDVAQRLDAPYIQSSTTIDTIQTAMEIDQRLSELETRARLNGSASGTGFLYPVTVERVAEWAKGLPGRGFVLVPASAIVPHTK